MYSRVKKWPTRCRTLLPRRFLSFRESRVSPRLSSSKRMFHVVVEWFEGDEFRHYLDWKTIKMVWRPKEKNVAVFENSPRSSRKGHPRLSLDVPDALKSFRSILQRDL